MVAIEIEKLGGRGVGHHVARCSVVENYHEQPQDRKPCSCLYSAIPILTFLRNTVAMKHGGDGDLPLQHMDPTSNISELICHKPASLVRRQSPGSYI